MFPMRLPLACCSLLLLPAALSGATPVQLLENSPFLPPGGAAAVQAAPAEQVPIELRGISTLGGETRFSIYNPATQQSVWLKLDEAGHDFVVTSYNAEADSVNVTYGGRTILLSLPKGQVVALAPQRPNNNNQARPPGMPGGDNQPRQLSSDEQRRLEAVAEEVRRRRALRQAGNTGAAPARPGVPPTGNRRR